MESILSAVIAGAVTLIGVLIANSRSQAVTDTNWRSSPVRCGSTTTSPAGCPSWKNR